MRNQDTVIMEPGVITSLAYRVLEGLEINFRVATISLSLVLALSVLDNISTYIIDQSKIPAGNYSG